MPVIKGIIILAEFLLLVSFIIPVILGIVNVGNITGITCSVLLLAVTVFHKQLGAFAKSMWEHISGKIVISGIVLLVSVCVLFAGYLSARMLIAAYDPPEKPCTVVVLGCQVRGTNPSLMLRRRLDAACEYMEENPEVMCIVSGGQGKGEDISEAEAMKIYLTDKGISEERILMEDKSGNTAENIAFSGEIIEQEGLSDEIVIVTDAFHQYRAEILAEKNGLTSYSRSCKTRTELIPTYWVREWFALVKEIFLT